MELYHIWINGYVLLEYNVFHSIYVYIIVLYFFKIRKVINLK